MLSPCWMAAKKEYVGARTAVSTLHDSGTRPHGCVPLAAVGDQQRALAAAWIREASPRTWLGAGIPVCQPTRLPAHRPGERGAHTRRYPGAPRVCLGCQAALFHWRALPRLVGPTGPMDILVAGGRGAGITPDQALPRASDLVHLSHHDGTLGRRNLGANDRPAMGSRFQGPGAEFHR